METGSNGEFEATQPLYQYFHFPSIRVGLPNGPPFPIHSRPPPSSARAERQLYTGFPQPAQTQMTQCARPSMLPSVQVHRSNAQR